MLEDFHNQSLRYNEWLEDRVSEDDVIPESRQDIYYIEARRMSLWRRLLNIQGRVIYEDWVYDFDDVKALVDDHTDRGLIVTIEAQPLR